MRVRFSIARLLGAVVVCGVAFAALSTPSHLWAMSVFTLMLAVLAVGLVNLAVCRRGGRAFWVGFAIAGWVSVAATFGPWPGEWGSPRLVTTAALDLLYPLLAPSAPAPDEVRLWRLAGGNSNAVINLSGVQGIVLQGTSAPWSSVVTPSAPQGPDRWTAWTTPDRVTGAGVGVGGFILTSPETYRVIGHSLLTLALAWLGGAFAASRGRTATLATAEANESGRAAPAEMTRPGPRRRPSLAAILGIVAIAAAGAVAFRFPSLLWSAAFYTLALAALTAAAIGVTVGRGRPRAFWAGFLICGGVYFTACLTPWFRDQVGTRVVTLALMDLLYEATAPEPPATTPGLVLALIDGRLVTAPSGRLAAWSVVDRSDGTGYPIGPIALAGTTSHRRGGHALLTLAAGALGGLYARRRHDRVVDA